MNSLVQSIPAAPSYGTAPTLSLPMQIGIVLSILLHVLLLLVFRVAPPKRAGADDASTVHSLVVWVRKSVAPKAVPVPVPMPPTAPRKPLAAGQPRMIAPAPDAVHEPAPAAPGPAPEVSAAQASPQTPQDQDDVARARDLIDNARKLARVYAREGDPSHATNPITLAESKRMAEPKLARDIANGKRRDCKDGLPGGLLAPIFLLLEKKDSGCKW